MADTIATREGAVAPELVLEAEGIRRERRSRWRRASISFWFGVALLGLILIVMVAAPMLAPYDPIKQDFLATLQAPSAAHPMGTDNFGRDILSRVIWGTRIDMQIGLFSVIFPFMIGTFIGCVTGYFGGALDTLVG